MKRDLPDLLRRRRHLRYTAWFGLVIAATALAAAPLRAEEVTIKHNGLTLNADLILAEGKTIEDGVVLMTHALLQHHRMEIMRVITGLFRESGYSTLAINYSAGLDNRRGPYDCATPHRHTVEGYIEEIGLWIDWLKQRGAGRLIMTGHSGGANKIIQFMAGQDEPLIRKVVLFAPGTADHFGRTPEGYKVRYRKDLEPIIERAQSLVESGKGDSMMDDIDFIFCPRTQVSARTFLSFYDPANVDHRNMPRQLRAIKKPTLVIGAGEDNIAPDMARLVKPVAGEKENMRLIVLEGCGHFFRDLCADDAVETAVEFLKE